jgi:hypothetical protein
MQCSVISTDDCKENALKSRETHCLGSQPQQTGNISSPVRLPSKTNPKTYDYSLTFI